MFILSINNINYAPKKISCSLKEMYYASSMWKLIWKAIQLALISTLKFQCSSIWFWCNCESDLHRRRWPNMVDRNFLLEANIGLSVNYRKRLWNWISWPLWLKGAHMCILVTFSKRIQYWYFFKTNDTYRFRSNVDSSWKTCARENTVRVFFLRLFCVDPFGWGELLSEGLSTLSDISSSIISFSSSSDSSFAVFIYDEWWTGDGFIIDVGGLADGDAFSVVFVDELSAICEQNIQLISNIPKNIDLKKIPSF